MLRESDDLDTPIVMRMSDNPSVDFDFISKLLIVGNSAVGKSQLFNMFADETFSEEHKPTLLVEYRHRFIDTLKSRCKVQIWDCLSSSSPTMMSSIYKGAHGIILLYDVTNRDSLEASPDWLAEIKSYASPSVVVYLVGTKTDLPGRKVPISDGKAMAEKLGIKYFEVSSKTGENVDSLFCKVVNDLKDVNALSTATSTNMSAASTPQPSRQDANLISAAEGTSGAGEEKQKKTCCTIM